ncbi:MAG: hypothetical protein R3E91_02680 [Chlamydiales bacterium]
MKNIFLILLFGILIKGCCYSPLPYQPTYIIAEKKLPLELEEGHS